MPYPRPKQQNSWLRYILALGALGALILGVITISIYLLNKDKVADLGHYEHAVPFRIYSSDNELLKQYKGSRDLVKFDELPPTLIDAVVSAEDQSFFEHHGVSFTGLIRATFASFMGKPQGGSTLTMQVAKLYLTGNKRTLWRKYNQIVLAFMIEHEYSKKEIMELYLNEAYFGHGAYGIKAAAKAYYNKTLDQLTLNEAAMLAATIQSPARHNPAASGRAKKAIWERKNAILKQMLNASFITPQAHDASIVEIPTLRQNFDRPLLRHANYIGTMIQAFVNAGCPEQKISNILEDKRTYSYEDNQEDDTKLCAEDRNKNGLKIFTSINAALQEKANQAIRTEMEKKRYRTNPPQAALVAINPKNGAVLALTGGTNFEDENTLNRAVDANRQMGSSIKPFIYAAALAKNITLAKTYMDGPFSAPDGNGNTYAPENAHDEFTNKPMRLREALVHSNNIVSVQLLNSIGVAYCLDYLEKFGIVYTGQTRKDFGLSLALGSAGLTPIEAARAYAVFANGGYLINPYLITKIEDATGKILYEAHPTQACEQCENPASRVLDSDNVFLINSALRDVLISGTAGGTRSILRRADLAGKTGTTNDYRDAWFDGYSADVLATVWVGRDDNTPLPNKTYGATIALPIWTAFMKTALEEFPNPVCEMDNPAYKASDCNPMPAGITTATIDPDTGYCSNNEDSIIEYFMPGTSCKTEPEETTNPLAPSTPPPPSDAPQK